MFGQSLGDGAADASRGAGDDRDPRGQVEQTGQDFLPKGKRGVTTIALFAAPTLEGRRSIHEDVADAGFPARRLCG